MILMMMLMTINARRAKNTVCATMHFCDSAEVGALDLYSVASSRCLAIVIVGVCMSIVVVFVIANSY